jgi:hypothetical protein
VSERLTACGTHTPLYPRIPALSCRLRWLGIEYVPDPSPWDEPAHLAGSVLHRTLTAIGDLNVFTWGSWQTSGGGPGHLLATWAAD